MTLSRHSEHERFTDSQTVLFVTFLLSQSHLLSNLRRDTVPTCGTTLCRYFNSENGSLPYLLMRVLKTLSRRSWRQEWRSEPRWAARTTNCWRSWKQISIRLSNLSGKMQDQSGCFSPAPSNRNPMSKPSFHKEQVNWSRRVAVTFPLRLSGAVQS